jgi:hypothetical protein
MILVGFGKLSVAQALTNGSVVSTNIIDLGAVAKAGLKDVWAVVDTEVVAGAAKGSTSTFAVICRAASDTGITTGPIIAQVTCAYLDTRILTAGKHIMALNIGKMLEDLATASFRYLGFYFTLSDGNGTATISVNASISPTEPNYLPDTQATISGRSAADLSALIPGVASAGSDTNA